MCIYIYVYIINMCVCTLCSHMKTGMPNSEMNMPYPHENRVAKLWEEYVAAVFSGAYGNCWVNSRKITSPKSSTEYGATAHMESARLGGLVNQGY